MPKIFKVTGYCPCRKCNGITDISASGIKPRANRTLCASNAYPFGTRINLDGYGTFFVEDRGYKIKDNEIERFFNTHQEALIWGVKKVKGTVNN